MGIEAVIALHMLKHISLHIVFLIEAIANKRFNGGWTE